MHRRPIAHIQRSMNAVRNASSNATSHAMSLARRSASRTGRLFAALLGVSLAVLPALLEGRTAQNAGGAAGSATPQTTRQTSDPYRGDLSIFEEPGREQRLQIDRVMDILGIRQNTVVADIGAGSGWFTVRASRRVGRGGRVFAEDINPKAIEHIADRAKKENLENIRVVLGSPDDPKLPRGSCGAVLLLKVYHEIAHPVPFMTKLRGDLHPDSLVGIIDRSGNGADHGLNRDVLEREMDEAGYKEVGQYDFTKADGQDYFLVFQPKA